MDWRPVARAVASTAGKRIAATLALSTALAGTGGVALMDHIKQEEALGDGEGRLVYIDPVGVRTWCYGDTGPVPNIALNKAVCEAQLDRRVREICVPVAASIRVPVYVHEMAAICSWAYNVGTHAAVNSTALRLLNQGRYDEVPNALLAWKYARGRDCTIKANNCSGMWVRRQREAAMFQGL